jgi:hypothetical protein
MKPKISNHPAPMIDADEIDYYLPIIDGGRHVATAVFGVQSLPGDDSSRKFLGVLSDEDSQRLHNYREGYAEETI